MDKELLESGGIDVEDALGRVMGNEQLLARLLRMFLADENLAALERAVGEGDAQAAEEASHALKGLAGNLSITPVHTLAAKQCDLFRAGAWDEATALLAPLADAYRTAQDAIRTGA